MKFSLSNLSYYLWQVYGCKNIMNMKAVKSIITIVMLFLCVSSFAQTRQLLVKAHHVKDKNQIIRIWRIPENKYILRTNYGKYEYYFDQEILYQHQKKVEYDGFSKRVTFKDSSEMFFVLTHVNEEYAFVCGFYSDALDDIVSTIYVIDFIDEKLFENL